MGRLKLDVAFIVFAIVLVNCFVQSQYYIEPPTPIYYLQEQDGQQTQLNYPQIQPDDNQQQQFSSRRGDSSQEDDEDDDEESEEPAKPVKPRRRSPSSNNGRSRPIKLPPDFDESIKRRMRVAKRAKRPLHGDPSPIHQGDDEEGRRPESRLLWPFSIEINKGKGGDGWGPGHFGSYTSWAASGWGDEAPPSTGWGSYNSPLIHPYKGDSGWGENKGLTDEEILESKHYKKYQKKKKKKIKKLKKKLKFKRLIQKILQKHITYLDKIAPY